MNKEQVYECFCKHAEGHDGDARLPWDKLSRMMSSCGLSSNSRDVVQTQLALRNLTTDRNVEENGIPFELYHQWYKLETKPSHFSNKNELLVKRVVQKGKLPTKNLPAGDYCYGEKYERDEVGAGEIALNWVPGSPSKSKDAGVSMIKANKAAIQEKNLTPGSCSRYLREHRDDPKLQKDMVVGKKGSHSAGHVEPNRVFGVSSYGEGSNNDMHQVVFPDKTNHFEQQDEPYYADLTKRVPKGKLPMPRPTHASESVKQHTTSKQTQEDKKLWKMSKFDKVESKIINK